MTVPDRAPEVTDTRPLLLHPREAKQRVELSESQVVASQEVWPDRDDVVKAMFAPNTLTTCAPVDGAFAVCSKLTHTPSKDAASDRLASTAPTLTAVHLLLITPHPTRHTADVSDAHDELSHNVSPDATDAVKSVWPIFLPTNVSDHAPGAFAVFSKLTHTPSKVTASDRLASTAPTLTTVLLLLITPRPTRHTAVVADSHVVISHEV